jgi:hypothetical protein
MAPGDDVWDILGRGFLFFIERVFWGVFLLTNFLVEPWEFNIAWVAICICTSVCLPRPVFYTVWFASALHRVCVLVS